MKPRVLIIVPHFNDYIFTKAALSIMEQLRNSDRIIFPSSGARSVGHVRNSLVEQAFKTDATHFMWLDGDQLFPKDMIPHLLAHDKDIVGAWTMVRDRPTVNVYRMTGKYNHTSVFFKNGLHQVDRMGFGSVLIKREVFEKLKKPWFEYTRNHETADLYFYDKARENGYKIYCDFDSRSLHISLTFQ